MQHIERLKAALEPLRDKARADKQSQYLKNHFSFLGVTSPLLQKAVKELLRAHSSSHWQVEVKSLWQQDEREFHYAALLWAIHHKKQAKASDLKLYEELIITNSWWDTVDTIAPHLIGHLLQKHPELIAKTEEWVGSKNLWLRRTSLLYSLRWKDKTDEERLFRYCTTLSTDKEFFIRKAIGWVLREYSKTRPDSVKRYLKSTQLSPLSVREAKKYLA